MGQRFFYNELIKRKGDEFHEYFMVSFGLGIILFLGTFRKSGQGKSEASQSLSANR